MLQGTVYKSTGKHYWVKTSKGLFKCHLRGRNRIVNQNNTNPIAVGDFVVIKANENQEALLGVIHSKHPSKNFLSRKSTQQHQKRQIIASNIDNALIIITLKTPKTYTEFIDRCLVNLEFQKINSCLVFNKLDIYDVQEQSEVDQLMSMYRNIGYRCFKVSAKTGLNIQSLKDFMSNKLHLLIGNSGVGKSSLINSMAPSLNLKTTHLTSKTHVGRHTTRKTQIFELVQNIRIIDSPGIKGFGLIDIPKKEIKHQFPEFLKRSHQCSYSDCWHINEPNCHVLEAVHSGEIASSRYNSYLSMLQTDLKYR